MDHSREIRFVFAKVRVTGKSPRRLPSHQRLLSYVYLAAAVTSLLKAVQVSLCIPGRA